MYYKPFKNVSKCLLKSKRLFPVVVFLIPYSLFNNKCKINHNSVEKIKHIHTQCYTQLNHFYCFSIRTLQMLWNGIDKRNSRIVSAIEKNKIKNTKNKSKLYQINLFELNWKQTKI